jgi:hypothetical protein
VGDLANLTIWDDPAIRDALSWYLEVAENRRPAKFRIAATVPHPCSAVYFQHGVVLPTNCPTTDGTKFETPSGALILGEPARYRT